MRNPCLLVCLLVSPALLISLVAHAEVSKKLTEERARLNDDVLRLSQPLKCSADLECDALEMGAKPCGGPWKYVLYSKKNPRVAKLKKALASYNAVDKTINESQQMMSDCMVEMKPEPKCVNKMCINGQAANQSSRSNSRPR